MKTAQAKIYVSHAKTAHAKTCAAKSAYVPSQAATIYGHAKNVTDASCIVSHAKITAAAMSAARTAMKNASIRDATKTGHAITVTDATNTASAVKNRAATDGYAMVAANVIHAANAAAVTIRRTLAAAA